MSEVASGGGTGAPPRAVVVFGPDSSLRNPRVFLAETARGFRSSLRVAPRLTLRALRGQYRNSLLGYFWIIGPSLAVTGVWLYLRATNVVNGGETRISYPVYVLVGTLLWMCFVDALNSPINQLTTSAQLLSKVSFPAESLLVSGLALVLVNALARLAIVVPILAIAGVTPTASLALFPVGLLALVLLGFSLGLLVAPIGALYRDVGQVLIIATSFLFLVTPVAYAERKTGATAIVSTVNPIRPSLMATRDWLTGGPAWPGLAWFVVLAAEVVLVAVGWSIYRLSIPHLVDRIN